MMHLLRWLSRWPLARLHALGALLGWVAWLASPSYRSRLKAQADTAGLDPSTRRRAIAEAGRMVGEVPWLWLSPPEHRLGNLVQWHGEQALEASLTRGAGTLLLTPHLGSFEVAARALTERFGHLRPLTALYRPARKPWLRALEESARHRPGLATAPANLAGVRQMLRALRRGEMVGVLPDQVPPDGQGVWAPFFGRPAYTMTLAARLQMQTGADLFMVWCERLPGGRGFAMHIEPPSPPLPWPGMGETVDAVASATALNQALESVIRQCPHQYLWGYHRYKRPRKPSNAEAAT